MDESTPGRNTFEGIAIRSLRNLDLVKAQREGLQTGHYVTQIYLTLLGVLVHPWEDEYRWHDIRQHVDLTAVKVRPESKNQDWPVLTHLRHAIAHGRVVFDSNSFDPAEVTVYFEDGDPVEQLGDKFNATWWASINAADMEALARDLASYL